MGDSYIKLLRKLLDWEWFNESEMVHIFIYLLLKANFTKGKFKGYEVDRGQLITGRKSISQNTGITEQSVRSCLNKLISTNEITIKVTNKFSFVTIVKYEDYQSFENKLTNKQPTKQPTTNQQLTTIEEGNKEIINTLSIFDNFRKLYPGTKRGNETEFNNFCKKNKDWEIILPKLITVIENQISSREIKNKKNEFVPEWKNLQTWINKRCWEEETSIIYAKKQTIGSYNEFSGLI